MSDNDDITIEPDEERDDSVVAEEHLALTVRKLRERLKGAEEKAKEYLDSWQRAQADFLNMRKRDEEAKGEFVKYASSKFASELIPVLDALSLAASGGVSGVENIRSLMLKGLNENGVEEIGQVGEAFDPNIHESVGFIKTDKKDDDHKVLEIMQKGYKLFDKVLRTARVRIGE